MNRFLLLFKKAKLEEIIMKENKRFVTISEANDKTFAAQQEKYLKDEEELKLKFQKERLKFQIEAAKEIADGEQNFHYAKELKGIELAKIDALIEERRRCWALMDEVDFKAILKEKDRTIEALLETLKITQPKSVACSKQK
jgi:hypothetical protein